MVPMNDADRKDVQGAVKEMVDSLYRIDAEKQLQKEIKARVKDDLSDFITPADFAKVVQIAYKENGSKIDADTTRILDLAEELGYYEHNPD